MVTCSLLKVEGVQLKADPLRLASLSSTIKVSRASGRDGCFKGEYINVSKTIFVFSPVRRTCSKFSSALLLQFLTYIGFHTENRRLNCTACSTIHIHVTPHITYISYSRLNWIACLRRLNLIIRRVIVLAVCESCCCR
jgi:hypothetical protein